MKHGRDERQAGYESGRQDGSPSTTCRYRAPAPRLLQTAPLSPLVRPRSQRCDHLVCVDRMSGHDVCQAPVERRMKAFAGLGVEVVASLREHIIQRHQLDDLAFGQLGRLIDDESSVVHVGS